MKWWESLPAWVRWILYLPAMAVTTTAFMLLFWFFAQTGFGYGHIGRAFMDLAKTGAFTAAIMVLGYELAPSGKRTAKTVWSVVLVLLSLIGASATVFNLINGISKIGLETVVAILQSIICIIIVVSMRNKTIQTQ